MQLFSNYTMNMINNYTWKLNYDEEAHKATLVNEHGEEMSLAALTCSLVALERRLEELQAAAFEHETSLEPLDELTRKRMKLRDYQLITHKKDGDTTVSVFEVYSDSLKIFTLDCYDVHNNRKSYDDGFLAFLNEFECKKLLKSLNDFVERCESES